MYGPLFLSLLSRFIPPDSIDFLPNAVTVTVTRYSQL